LNRLHLRALLLKAKELSGHSEFVIVGSLSILGAVSATLPPGRTDDARVDRGHAGNVCTAV
jgi:hypothetical protein